MKVEVNKFDIADVQYMLNGIKDGATKALVVSINKTLVTTNTQAAKAVGAYLALTAKRIKKDFKLEKANFQSVKGVFESSGKPIGLYQYAAKQLKTGVSFKIKKKGKRQSLRHAYIAKGKSKSDGTNTGNLHVFWRTKDGWERNKKWGADKWAWKGQSQFGALPKEYRLPVERKAGPRIEDILAKASIFNPLEKLAVETLQINLGKQVDAILRRFK